MRISLVAAALTILSMPAIGACESGAPKVDTSKAQTTAVAVTTTAAPMMAATTAMTASSNATATATAADAGGKGNGNILGLKRPNYDKKNPNWKFGVTDPGTGKFDPKKDYYATIHTTLGDITVKFFPE